MDNFEEIIRLLPLCNEQQKRKIFDLLRAEFSIHPLEKKLNIQAEIILEAIDRASDLTLRGVRGVIAEAAFDIHVLKSLVGWQILPLASDYSYDYIVKDNDGEVHIQVKMQRLKDHQPMSANNGYKYLSKEMYVVETQRTRGGKTKTGNDTRPYHFGDFDILAVSMEPSTHNWNSFMYTVANWLLPRQDDKSLILKFQPIPKEPNHDWTNNLEQCISWFREDLVKTIAK
ncbi:MAG: hypothetical protein PHQ40_12890 [Anaerolineaceae bacterium]|nr:hypothetical protein [Anaerolineaceae bacterium]